MKTRTSLFLAAVMLFLGIAQSAPAAVTGSGSFSLFFPEGVEYYFGGYNISGSYYDESNNLITVSNLFGNIIESPGLQICYGLDTSTVPYEGSGSYHGSSISASYNQSTGVENFTFSAVSPDPGNVSTMAVDDLIGSVSFYGTLQNFGYNYSFTGYKDTAEDTLTFNVQMEIKNQSLGQKVYSDYGPYDLIDPENNFQTNWASFSDTDSGTHSGTITFDYSSYGDQSWLISWDFAGGGIDTAGSRPVPAPATILLLGPGLAVLAGFRKRFR